MAFSFIALNGLVITLGAMMYVVEGRSNGFQNIPLSIYWAVITITTVGYGDIVPSTPMGKIIATIIMMLGYVIIAEPTGIMAVSLTNAGKNQNVSTQACPSCGRHGHDLDAKYYKYCEAAL